MFTTRRIITSGGDVYRDEYSLTFDGTDDYITCGSDSSIDDIWAGGGTCAGWINVASLGEVFGNVINKVNWAIHPLTLSGGACKFKLFTVRDGTDGQWQTDNQIITIDKWHHFAITYDSDSASNDPIIYIDGVSVAITEISGAPSSDYTSDASGTLLIGNNAATTRTYDGKISEIALWDTILSANQVKTLYNSKEPFDARNVALSNLQGYWRMGDGLEGGSGTTIYDMSGEGNDGTMTNMAADDFVGDIP